MTKIENEIKSDIIVEVDILSEEDEDIIINKLEYSDGEKANEWFDDVIILLDDLIKDKKIKINCRYNLNCNIIVEYTPSSPLGPEEHDAYLAEEIELIEENIIEKYYS